MAETDYTGLCWQADLSTFLTEINWSIYSLIFDNIVSDVQQYWSKWLTCFLWWCRLSRFTPLPQDYRKAITERSLTAGSGAPWARRGSNMRVACVLAAALEGTRTRDWVWAWRRPAGCQLEFYAGWLNCPLPPCPDISSKDWKNTGDFVSTDDTFALTSRTWNAIQSLWPMGDRLGDSQP